MIETIGLHKRHGKLEVLRGISLAVAEGEVAVIVGPSGGGKSTFLRCLNGLETFEAGEVRVGEHRLTPGEQDRADAGAAAAGAARGGDGLSAVQSVPASDGLAECDRSAAPRARPVARRGHRSGQGAARSRGLADKLDERPDRLSGGQQQRVAIARALAMQPRAILFDEPTSALDPRMTGEVLAVLADLASTGQTMVVVTHAMNFARRAAHRVHVFEDGQVLESGPPQQIFENPREKATAEFVRENVGP